MAEVVDFSADPGVWYSSVGAERLECPRLMWSFIITSRTSRSVSRLFPTAVLSRLHCPISSSVIFPCIIGKTNRDEIQNQMRLKFARKLQKRNVTEK